MIHELKTVMETMKAVSVVLIEDLGSEVDCGGNYENGSCGPIERLRHKDQKHALHSATGTSGLSLVFPRCSIGSHWTTRRIEVAVVANSKPPASFLLSVVSSNPAADSLTPLIFSMVVRPSPILALGAVCKYGPCCPCYCAITAVVRFPLVTFVTLLWGSEFVVRQHHQLIFSGQTLSFVRAVTLFR